MISSCIRSGESYGIEEFAQRTGLGKAGLRTARRAGLTVRYCHNRGYVTGDDWLQYLAQQSTTAPGPQEGVDPRHQNHSEVTR